MKRKFRWTTDLDDSMMFHKDGTPHTPDWATLRIADDFSPAYDHLYVPLDVHCDLCGLGGRLGIDIEPMIGSEEAIVWV